MAMTLISIPKMRSIPPMINMMAVSRIKTDSKNMVTNISYSKTKQKRISSSNVANLLR